jgi:TetR/AcrR family transcriptional regulator, transcriptional repressor for nem operon
MIKVISSAVNRMRYSSGHKAQTRQRIVASACRLFTSKGYDATSIGEIMADCGLTTGGFYAHFTNKAELYEEAIEHAASHGELVRDAVPAAFFVSDVASRESVVRSTYTRAFRSLSREIRDRAEPRATCSEESILSLTAMIVGAAAIAETTDDADLKAKLFAACKEKAAALLRSSEDEPLTYFWSAHQV